MQRYATASTPTPTSTPPSASSQESNDEFRPKRACSSTPRPAVTQVIIPRDVLKKVGPAADRLGLSHQQATAFLSSIINNSGGNLDEIAVSTSTARRSQATARAAGSFDKVNRLAVVAGTVERKRNYTYQLSKPGADSNARWMAKCLYVLKLSLLQHQIPPLTEQTKKKINTMSSFILHC